ncbi:hypothetical protein SEA_RAHALELUJAH_57 [Mycobacterium phage Rahalelujah]|nr:hypothetical protein SEA_RAHALELUJAH_57 [Mycobacterium phage Rahalelujah]
MSILTKAEEIINGQRAQDYGDALENHQRIATLWNAYLQKPVVDHNDVAVMMILLKIARFMENGYHQDTVVDIAGYAGVLEKMQLPKEDRYVAPTPRQWVTGLAHVPTDVKVRDNVGDLYEFRDGKWFWEKANMVGIEDLSEWDEFAPFTEVV